MGRIRTLKTDATDRSRYDCAALPVAEDMGRAGILRHFVARLPPDQDHTSFYADVLWVFLILELWHRQHVEA
jgi:hypothetical protein